MANEYDVPSSDKTLRQIYDEQRLGDRAGALVSGLANAPMDVAKYAQYAKNRMDQFAGYQNKAAADIESDRIRAFWDNPPFLSDNMNGFRQHLKETQPELHTIGEIAAGGLGGLGTAKQVYNLTKTGKQFNYMNRLTRNTVDSRAKLAAIGAGGAAFGEGVTEPLMDQYLAATTNRQ